jgi:hypothetical protein
MNTHKILISNDTGRIILPIYVIDDPRPCPPDATWMEIDPDTSIYKHYVGLEDVHHLDIEATYWDFETNAWIEVPTSGGPSYEKTRFNRNELLKQTDKVFAKVTDPVEIQQWITYRQQLRTMFDGLPEDFDWNEIIFPRTPMDIKALKDKAAAGDAFAIEIVTRDNL